MQTQTLYFRLVCLFLAAVPAFAQTRLLRQPSYHNGKVAFIYQNDLWTASEDGKNVKRLTATKAAESSPRFSPDGKWIAFTSNREGNFAVFVMPAEGGASRQLTYSGSNDRLVGWAPDGKRILFVTARGIGFGGLQSLWEVPLDGGMETQITPDRAAWGAYSPDMRYLAYNRHAVQGYRKHYRGSAAADLWVTDLAAKTFRRIDDPGYKGNWGFPMYGKDGNIYFIADRLPNEKTLKPGSPEAMKSVNNIWKVSDKGGKPVQVTHHTSGNLFNPDMSADGRTIVYEEDFGIWKLDVASGKTSEIAVRIDPPERDSPVETITIDNIADAFDLSPSAKRAAISARGRIFTIATEQGEVRRVTDTMAHDRMPRWSPDGKWIAFLSDRSGRDEVWISEERGSTTRKLTDLEGEKFGLVWAKDAKSVFCIVEEKLYRIATETGRQELIGKGDLDLTSPQVSPDGTWIAWAATTQDSMVRIFVKPLAGGEVHQVYQRGYVRASQPQWSPNGKKLLFLASNAGAVDTWQNTLFALTLQKEDKDPNYKGVDEEPEFVPDTPPATPPATASSTKTARNVEVKIDWDGMDRRMRQVTRLSDSINTYAVSPDSRAYVIVAAGQLYAIDDDGGRSTRLTQPTAGAPDAAPGEGGPPTGLQFSRDGRTVFFREGTAIYSASTASPQAGAAAPTKKKLTFTVRATADSRLQRHFVFNEACRMIQDHYYDRKLNGLDWDAVRRQYEPLLEFVDDQEGLADLLRQMIGELNTSHTGATAPVQPGAPRAGSGHPGFDLAPDSSGYYRVTHILKNGPADKDYVKLQKGDYLLAVNDQSLKSGDNYWKAFRGGPGRTLELTVNSKPAMDGSWRIRISPAGDSRTLYYDEWVAERKAQVDKLSGGEIGYIHLRIMTPDIMPQFEAELYEYRLKKGLILDVRFNGGGNLEMQLLKDLASRHYMSLISSKGIEFPRPARGFSGSIVVLQNENSGSNAEMFPEAVRAAGLGKLVGMPTPGMVLLSSDFALSDGTHLAIGHGHIQTLRGENMENNGVQPDVLVDNLPADVATGRDAQLEKAVEVLRGIR